MLKKGRKVFFVIGINFAAIAAYFLLAMMAKASFAWQSSVITLWPAAGFANAMAVAHGPLVLPGLAIANFLGTAFNPNTGYSFQPFMVPVAIAAALQAAFVRWILIRRNFLDDPLTRISRICFFLLWIGILGNWPAAITFLFYKLSHSFPAIPLDDTFASAFFWWIGDSLGSLLFLPLFLLWVPFKNPIWAKRAPHMKNQLLALNVVLFLAAFVERLLLQRIELTPELFEPLQDLRLLATFAWILIGLAMLGFILQISGKSLEQEKQLIRSRLAGDAAGVLIHEIGQPLIRLRLRLERIVDFYKKNSQVDYQTQDLGLEIKNEVELSFEELDSIVLNTKSIHSLTLAGIRDTDSADLKDAVNLVSTQLRPDMDRLDQDLTIKIADQLPKINIGQIQLQAAIRNLLINAINAAGENGVMRINIEFSSPYYVTFEIEDSGTGFNPNQIPQGYSRFNSTTGGMGLGLMIVRRIIDDNGGTLDFAESPDLGGARVIIRLTIKPNK